MTTKEKKLGLIGRDHKILEDLTKNIRWAVRNGLTTGPMGGGKHIQHHAGVYLMPTSDRRGFYFEVRTVDERGKTTGHIARVEVTLARLGDE
jgi:hypothetical protein